MSDEENYFWLKNYQNNKIYTGEMVTGILEIQWRQEFNSVQLMSLKNYFINNDLYLVRPLSIIKSEINPQMMLFEALLVFIRPVNWEQDQPWELGSHKIMVRLKQPFTIEKTLESDQLLIVPQEFYQSSSLILYSLLIIGFFFLMATWKIIDQRRKRVFLRSKVDASIKNKFLGAEKREDYEAIYQLQQQWVPKISGNENGKVEYFLKTIEERQYKQHWSDQDFELVKEAFSNCRELL